MKFKLTVIALLVLLQACLAQEQPDHAGLEGAYGSVQQPKDKISAKLVSSLKNSPSNPDVTCIRAKVAVNIAKSKLEESKENLKKALEANFRVGDAKQMVLRCQMIYDKAIEILKSVQVAKEETRNALKKYDTIEKEAKDAERKAIYAEEQVQMAKNMVKRAEKNEYEVRQCRRKPRKLNSYESHIVKKLVTKKENMIKRKTKATKLLKILNHYVKNSTGKKKEKLERKMKKIKKILKKIEGREKELSSAIEIIQRPDKPKPKKRRLVKTELKIVKKLEVVLKKNEAIKSDLEKNQQILVSELKKGPKEEKPFIQEKLDQTDESIKKIQKKIRLVKISLDSIKLSSSSDPYTKIKKRSKRKIERRRKKVEKLHSRVNIIDRKISTLKSEVRESLEETKKPKIVKRISYLQDMRKKTLKKVEKLREEIHALKSNKLKIKKRKRTEMERKVLKSIRSDIIKKIKRVVVIKRHIKKLELESEDDPDKEDSNNVRIDQYKKIIKDIRKEVVHLKKTVRKLKYQVEIPLVEKKKPKFRKVNKIEKIILGALNKKLEKVVHKYRKTNNKILNLEESKHKIQDKKKVESIDKTVTELKKELSTIHKSYKRVSKTIIRMAPQTELKPEKPPKRAVHFLHSIFKCKMVPPPAELSGPIAGDMGKSKMQNLKQLIAAEKKQMVEIQEQIMRLRLTIKKHKLLIKQEKQDLN